MFEVNSLIVALVICLPAIVLASQRSTFLVDYLFFVIALNRGIRRVVDYHNGFFNPFSLISLTPIIVCGLASLFVLLELNSRSEQFGQRTLKVLYLYTGIVGFAFIVGFFNSKFAAVYALGDYLAPIGLLGFAALFADQPKIISRWANSFAVSVLVVAIYGLWQFYTIPPWDRFWLIAVDFVGYMGLPEPGKMTLFSTMSERGPAAMYLCNGLILVALRPGTLSILRWPAAVVIAYAMLLTYSRTTVIFAGLALLLYPLLNRGTNFLTIAVLVIGGVIFGPAILSKLPGQATARVNTIGNIQADGSFLGRIQILGYAISEAITAPLGTGIGTHGMASRVQQASKAGIGDSTGYVENLRTYGWIGFCVLVFILWKLWDSSRQLLLCSFDDRDVRLFRSWFLAGMAALFSGNWLAGASFFWVLAGHTLGVYDQVFGQAEAIDGYHPLEDGASEDPMLEVRG
jgi:putative inorganic carbon (HCO3(-)) transporter